ncbi:histone deacetylase [Siphonobacter sp. SORGH_AS_1065]|uniref:histone deacetylase family protein n=1 Tax=Siphonobacter sp. SORGH_AS_1065 TaxID=3041795 RepID=UPI002781E0AC|nr:histone deacetylase [Siphonobacter sp. SORGH_AS_1065]MDQ1088871.1 acetoin utilization deacetylase AcuC-like enzyme [Siphonobacter sp. SORGH_AS_1065]
MLKIAYAPEYCYPLPEGHRFPMEKYELIPQQLLREGTVAEDSFFVPQPIEEQWILTTHTEQYWHDLRTLQLSDKMVRRIGFPLTEQLVQREIIIAQGTIDCCHYARKYGVAMNVAGGTHHAYADKGEGFCLLNDVGIAANYLLKTELSKKILVIDLDVHQGNGTACIFEKEPRVFTFSMHGKDNYPLHKEKSDLDIELATHTQDETYLALLAAHLPALIEEQKPDFLFFISGVDVLGTDKLGKLSLTKEGCKKRDEMVFHYARQSQLPIVVVMGGGYSKRLAAIVEAHCNTFRLAETMYFQ